MDTLPKTIARVALVLTSKKTQIHLNFGLPQLQNSKRFLGEILRQEMHSIHQIHEWPSHSIEGMLTESEQEGFRFVRRAQAEWLSGTNTFTKEGEAFFGVSKGECLVAIVGVNRESDSCGRLRRLYVRPNERKNGMGRQLVQHVIDFSRRHYDYLVLRCDTSAADQFYQALGFARSSANADITHSIKLTKK